MLRTLTTSATGMISQQYNLDTIANNLANVNTTGFKHQSAQFQDLIYQTFKGASANTSSTQVGLGSSFSSTASDFTQGAMQATGNPLDLAINGPNGFFQVTKPDGSLAYTRDGSFTQDQKGQVVTSDGYPLDPPIVIPTNATAVAISNVGVVSVTIPGQPTPTQLGPIQLALFPNPAGMARIGQNLFSATPASGAVSMTDPGVAGASELSGGFLEGSNVQVVEEMVKMIMAQRAYEINSKCVQTADDMLSTINTMKR